MKILFLNRHAYENGVGGLTEYLHHLPPALKPYEIEAVLYHEGSSSQLTGPHYLKNGMCAYSGPFLKPGFFTSSKALKPLIDLCKTENIKLIHAQGTYRSGFVALQIHKQTKIPYLITSHSDIVPSSKRMHRAKILRRCRKILAKAAGVTHLSPTMEKLSHEIYDTRDKSVLIGNGIDADDWLNYATWPEKNYLLALGRLEREKGFHVLVDAFAELYKKGTKTSLILAGEGKAEADLYARVKQYGVPIVTQFTDFDHIPESSVIFTGYLRGELKKQVLAQCLMVLFPTQPHLWEEPFGIVQIEAMAAGKAVIASDSATTRHLKSLGLEVLLVNPVDPQAWAQQIQQLLGDVDLRKNMQAANLMQAQNFDWDYIAKRYRDIYLECVGE